MDEIYNTWLQKKIVYMLLGFLIYFIYFSLIKSYMEMVSINGEINGYLYIHFILRDNHLNVNRSKHFLLKKIYNLVSFTPGIYPK